MLNLSVQLNAGPWQVREGGCCGVRGEPAGLRPGGRVMCSVEFSQEELEVICQVLQHNVDEVTVELSHTATREYKEMLKRRRAVLEDVREKLFSAAAAT
jgi:hypothetical protein